MGGHCPHPTLTSPRIEARWRTLLLFGPLLGLAFGASGVSAQVRFAGLEGSVAFVGWSGRDFRILEEDARFSLAPLFRVGRDWQVGIEGYAGSVGFELGTVDSRMALRRSGDELGINAIARRIVGDPDTHHLYLQLRTGWTELDSKVVSLLTIDPNIDDPRTESFSTTGFTVGPEVGVRFAPGRTFGALLAAGFTWNRYGETQIFGPFDFSFGKTTSAIRWGVRAGVMVRNPLG